MQLKEILNEQRIYAILNKVPILRESEVHLFEELIGLYEPSRVLEVGDRHRLFDTSFGKTCG